MSRRSFKFGDKGIKKSHFCNNKKPFNIDDIDANKILISKEELYSNKEK